MKYTKGPWQVGDLVENDYEPRHVEVKGPDDVKLIAKAVYGQTDEDCATNAHLIAAAPELLEACKAVGDAMLKTQGFMPNFLEQAINKAEGR